MLKNEEDVIKIIREDEWMMDILKAAKSLNLPDWWICAGFVRSKIWDTLHEFNERTNLPDVDVIYFDKHDIDKRIEKKLEERLKNILDVPWSVKNQVRMHVVNNVPPYSSSMDAISKFPETATALGVKLDNYDHIILTAPWGIADVINLEVKPTAHFTETKERAAIYNGRMVRKNWKFTWHNIEIRYI